MEEAIAVSDRDSFFQQPQFWKGLFLLAIILNLMAIFTSDLGLDAHVEGAYVETENGWSLNWGDVRTEDPLASDPSNAREVPTSSITPGTIMSFAVLGMIIAILVAVRMDFSRETITVLMLNPALIFSIGRGYSEYGYLAMIGAAWALWRMSRNYESERGIIARITAIILASILILLVLVLKWKIEPLSLFFPLLGLTVVGIFIDRAPEDWFNPQRVMCAGFGFGLLSVVGMGVLGYGSFSVVTTEPVRFIQALPISIFGVIIVYGIVGMALWPFARDTWRKMAENDDRLTGELSLFIGTMAGAIVAYVACLWTYESILWNSEWPWHMWTMGNNGRYITILAIPSYLLIKRVNGELDWSKQKAIMGVLMILPISLAAGLHGQTYWTDEAAEVLSDNLEDGEDFVFVHDETLGMHYLYTFHTYIDDVTERNITGHWRAPDSGWGEELLADTPMENRGDLSLVEWVVLAPGIEWEEVPDGWYQTSGHADFMNGGGEWQLWTTHSELVET
ncbi:MAG: hypothetical protein OSB32_02335 [Candidatus Poseidoniales archaeon]|nr:hypothetical protein [Candidatus Poseidoniales archaeon]